MSERRMGALARRRAALAAFVAIVSGLAMAHPALPVPSSSPPETPPPPAAPASIGPAPEDAPEDETSHDLARYPRREVVLSDEEASAVERGVLRRCGLDESTDRATAPWYYHYELGLEMAERGDPQRAVDALVSAVERRDDPERSTRIYGMWFIDYLPYFQIARLHATLGNLDCARDALRLSKQKGEWTPNDDEYDDLQVLELELELEQSPDQEPMK